MPLPCKRNGGIPFKWLLVARHLCLRALAYRIHTTCRLQLVGVVMFVANVVLASFVGEFACSVRAQSVQLCGFQCFLFFVCVCTQNIRVSLDQIAILNLQLTHVVRQEAKLWLDDHTAHSS